jgi:hypothetical protein
MRLSLSGRSPDIIDVNVQNTGTTVIVAGTTVYFNVDGLTVTETPNSNEAGVLIDDLQPNGGIGYARKMGPLDGSYIPLSGGGGGGTTLQLSYTTEPTPDVTQLGKLILVAGGTGVADELRMCIKDALDNYIWTTISLS